MPNYRNRQNFADTEFTKPSKFWTINELPKSTKFRKITEFPKFSKFGKITISLR